MMTLSGRRMIGAAVLALMALAGCALNLPEAAPLRSAALTKQGWIEGAAGASIAIARWEPPSGTPVRATILAVHGFADYGPSTFESAAQAWAERGIRTIGYDQRGFGRNPSRGDWPGAGALIDDLAVIAKTIPREGPLIVLGHSMGGAVVAAAIGEGRIEPDAAILLAPALWGGRYLPAPYRLAAGSAALLFPNKRWSGRGVVRIQASDNIEVLRALGRDPLYLGPPSSREFLGLIRLMDRAVASAPNFDVPSLTLYGAFDEVVPEMPIREITAQFAEPGKYERVSTGWHLLLRDLEAAAVHERIADYALAAAR